MMLDEYTGSAPLAITLGDPAGIGPEVVARVVSQRLRQPPTPTPHSEAPIPKRGWLLIGSEYKSESK
ncbi:MAG: hypothetical protein ACKOZX_06825, partial [Gammaproteobacteria bacterium]